MTVGVGHQGYAMFAFRAAVLCPYCSIRSMGHGLRDYGVFMGRPELGRR